jgi:tRNA (adenine57-N1/adenine58-N1)-methyltransferase
LQTHHGHTPHTDFIGKEEGSIVTNNKGALYVIFRPSWAESGVKVPRGAAVVYPKDAAAIVLAGDIKPGDHVCEIAAGSGALTSYLLRAVGPSGHVYSFEARQDFAEIATKNVQTLAPQYTNSWTLEIEEVTSSTALPSCDVVVFDLLKPWELLPPAAGALRAGGHLVAYVTTTTQMSEVSEALRTSGEWFEPVAQEVFWRDWHVLGLSVRPAHSSQSHTGFLVSARRMSHGTLAPDMQRRTNKSAYRTKPMNSENSTIR